MALEDTETLFQKISNEANYLVSKVVDYDYSLKWVKVFETGQDNRSVGLAENGCWVVCRQEEIIILSSERSFMRAVVLLEFPKSTIINKIESYLESMNVEISADTIFPFSSVVKAGLEFGTEYWAELAFKWLEELDLNAKIIVRDVLKRIVQEKLLTQKLRHKALKLLANLGGI